MLVGNARRMIEQCVGRIARTRGVRGQRVEFQRGRYAADCLDGEARRSLADLGGDQAERAVNRLSVRCVSCVSIYPLVHAPFPAKRHKHASPQIPKTPCYCAF